MGVTDFIPKPIDRLLLQRAILKTVIQLNQAKISTTKEPEQKPSANVNFKDDSEFIMKKLDIIYRSHIPIEFINHYRGIPIVDDGRIVNVSGESITIDAPYFQTLAIKYEGSTIINSEFLDYSIILSVDKRHGHNDSLVMNNIEINNKQHRKNKKLAVEPSENLSTVIKSKDKFFSHEIDVISSDFISVVFNANSIDFEEGDELDLEINVESIPDTSKHHTPVTYTINTKGKIYSLIPNEHKGIDARILFELESKDKEYINDYLTERRKELITEFKQLKKV